MPYEISVAGRAAEYVTFPHLGHLGQLKMVQNSATLEGCKAKLTAWLHTTVYTHRRLTHPNTNRA